MTPWHAHIPEIQSKARGRATVGKSGRPFIRKLTKTRAYEEMVGTICRAARGTDPISEGWVVVGVIILDLVPASWRRTKKGALTLRARRAAWQIEPAAAGQDTDNVIKAVLDGADKIWYRGDAKVLPPPWRGWTLDPARAGVHLFLWPAPTPADAFAICYGPDAPFPRKIRELAAPPPGVPRP